MNSLSGNGKKKRSFKVSSTTTSKKVSAVSQRKKGKARTGPRKGRSGGRSSGRATLTPNRKVVWLEYVSTLSVAAGASVTSRAYPIYSNGAFAVDPAAPSGFTTTPGFSVGALQYAAYRVRRYKGSITFINTGGGNMETVVCHTNSALGASAGGTNSLNILQFAANRPEVNTIKPIGQNNTTVPGGVFSKAVHTFDHSIQSITGESINQPGYKSLTNTVPSILTYIVFGFVAQTAFSLSATVDVKIKFLVEFSDYIDTLASFTDVSEDTRLSRLGTPVDIQPCAGCRYVQSLEQAPCPDPDCVQEDFCTNCGFTRRCSLNCQSPHCPWKAETIKILPPLLTKKKSTRVFDNVPARRANAAVGRAVIDEINS